MSNTKVALMSGIVVVATAIGFQPVIAETPSGLETRAISTLNDCAALIKAYEDTDLRDITKETMATMSMEDLKLLSSVNEALLVCHAFRLKIKNGEFDKLGFDLTLDEKQ